MLAQASGQGFRGHGDQVRHASAFLLGLLFFLANLPFLVFSYFTMGRGFMLKTLVVNVTLSAATQGVPLLLTVSSTSSRSNGAMPT